MKGKRAVKVLFLFFLILPALCFAHFIIFPRETRCMLICFSAFNKAGNIYYKNTSPANLDRLRVIINSAQKKDSIFWKENARFAYKIIFCNEKDFGKYAPASTPAATYMKLGAYIVIKNASLDENILSHEISHTILYRNIGWYNRTFKIPTWFDEGLAMQVDDRNYYSIYSLLANKQAALAIQNVIKLEKPADFFRGSTEEVILNYSAAKYIVNQWLQKHSLQKFIAALNAGSSFSEAYKSKAGAD